MKKLWLGLIVLFALAAAGCNLLTRETTPVIPEGVRVIKAVRAKKPPIIDGKLDDAVWKKAVEITGFKRYNSDKRASYQNFGYVLYDDTHLYIGVKCLLPQGVKPKGEMRPHDGSGLFRDDVVEIMLDPGYTRSNYYQLVINAYGATFDCSREKGGGHEDDAWDGEWVGKAHISDGYYCVEMAVPFHNLGITSGVGSTWGMNLCREAQTPVELSSIALGGTFNNAERFAVLDGVNVDFRKYAFKIGPGLVALGPSTQAPTASLTMPVTNLSGSARAVVIDVHGVGPDGEDDMETQEMALADNETVSLPLGVLPVKPLFKGDKNTYAIQGRPATKKVVVSDVATKTVLSAFLVKKRKFLKVMQVEVDDPWRADMSQEKTQTVSLKVRLAVAQVRRLKGTLVATLTSRKSGKEIARKTVKGPGPAVEVRFDTGDIPWDAYNACVTFKDAGGQEVVADTCLATVLPGGRHRIQVLNNLVSELMDAGARNLIWDKAIDFMNPRDGWCFFSLSGTAALRLDTAAGPFVKARQGERAAEAMRWVPAGRHTLHVEGQPEALVVRAIPELIYCNYPSNPYVRAHGLYDWEFLSKHVLPNCNLIIGGVYPDEMRAWRAQGKRWLTQCMVPGLREKRFVSADYSYKQWQKSRGYSHPLMDGIIADEFLNRPDDQYLAWTESVLMLHRDPKFRGRLFYPWCGAVHILEGGRIFVGVNHKLGGRHCFEQYLAECSTEQKAAGHIHDVLINNAKGWESNIPGSVRKCIVTLGYLSHPTESLNTHPSADYKVYMDMQFEALATHPIFFGTYGIMEYTSSYADEENVRWAGRLYRHYCIEGRKERLSSDPYDLAHILNPDFDDGTKHWKISAAEKGNVTVRKHDGYSWLQGRYPRTSKGDNFLLVKRSARKPNVFSQAIKDLQPGRLYSMKMITGDYQDLAKEISKKKVHAVSIKLDNVDVLPGPKNSFQYVISNHPTAHKLGKFQGSHKYWINYHWRVFRATGTTASLTISDWKSANEPGAPVGQELMFNFIEVQPYFD